MSTLCLNGLLNPNTQIDDIHANTPVSGNIANLFVAKFYKFELTKVETVFFSLNITPLTAQPINVKFTLYRKDGEVYTDLGTSVSDEVVNSFHYAAVPAEYYICLTSDWNVNYTLEAEFTDFPFSLLPAAEAHHGSHWHHFDFARQTASCDSPVFYTIIEGTLPEGLTFNPDGYIAGNPIEQDCEELAKDQPPSFMWSSKSEDGTVSSEGIMHRVVVRAALVDAPETFADREFFVCIRNNWDYDLKSFMDSRENWTRPTFEIEGKESWRNPPEEATPPEPPLHEIDTSKISGLCDPCVTPEPKQATLEELRELAKQIYVAPQFEGLVKLDENGLCVVCDEPESDIATIEVQDIQLEDSCLDCPEPQATSLVLETLPESLCPDCIEIVEIEISKPRYVPGIPKNCFPELLWKMQNVKVCNTGTAIYHTCNPEAPIYPQIEPEDQILESACPPMECN